MGPYVSLHYIRLKSLTMDKHSSLLGPFISYKEIKVLWIQLKGCIHNFLFPSWITNGPIKLVLQNIRVEILDRENTLAYWAHLWVTKKMKCCECSTCAPFSFISVSCLNLTRRVTDFISNGLDSLVIVMPIDNTPICLPLEEVTVRASHEVLMEVDANTWLIVGNLWWTLAELFRPHPFQL